MSLDFVDSLWFQVPLWVAGAGPLLWLLVWSLRRTPPESVSPLQHAKFRIVQVFVSLLLVLWSLLYGPGNYLPGILADLAGVVSGPAIVVLLLCFARTVRRLCALEEREKSLSTSEEITF
ncbi:MAG: hypothetical protein IPK85_02930 [Gemmatimonadetes bacterium]|nr:hypothetical protein [Gemmatimonadota bacterium]